MGQQNFQSLLPKDDVNLSNYQDALDYAMEHDEIAMRPYPAPMTQGKAV